VLLFFGFVLSQESVVTVRRLNERAGLDSICNDTRHETRKEGSPSEMERHSVTEGHDGRTLQLVDHNAVIVTMT
jgi:hypothetical protein